jgi:hypothetical protein
LHILGQAPGRSANDKWNSVIILKCAEKWQNVLEKIQAILKGGRLFE